MSTSFPETTPNVGVGHVSSSGLIKPSFPLRMVMFGVAPHVAFVLEQNDWSRFRGSILSSLGNNMQQQQQPQQVYNMYMSQTKEGFRYDMFMSVRGLGIGNHSNMVSFTYSFVFTPKKTCDGGYLKIWAQKTRH